MQETLNTPQPGLGAPAPLRPSESLEEFEDTRKQFFAELQPGGIVESTLVYQAAATAWRLRRLPYIESVLFDTLLQNGSASKELEFISRHETRLLKSYHQILRELRSRKPAAQPASAARGDESRPAEPRAEAPPSSFAYRAYFAGMPQFRSSTPALHTSHSMGIPPPLLL